MRRKGYYSDPEGRQNQRRLASQGVVLGEQVDIVFGC